MTDWKTIESAPREPIERNCINSFTPRLHGPTLILGIDYSGEANPTNAVVTAGWWSPQDGCWRCIKDDGPNDVQPTWWAEFPEPPES